MANGAHTRKASREKRGAAFVSLLAAAIMALVKLAAGVWSGSLGMLSEAAHSSIDCVGSLLTLLSVRVADKPADADHPYGHGKIENVSAFLQTFLMVASAAWIVEEAVKRILRHDEPLRISLWPFLVLVLSMLVDYWRAHRLRQAAKKFGSQALAADAAHFSTDVLTSIAVLIGLGCAWASPRLHMPRLAYADSVAALAVAAVILGIAWRLARPTVDQLLDVVPEPERARIIHELKQVNGVLSVDRVRLRKSGSRFYTDISLGMARTLTFQRSEQLVRDATRAVHRVLPGSDVVVHPQPRASRGESIFDRVRAVASRHNVSVHDLSVHEVEGSLRAELHLEVNESMQLREAHDFVTSIEQEILRECPELEQVLTHIENEPCRIELPQVVHHDQTMIDKLRRSASTIPQITDVHDIVVRRVGDHSVVSCHCTLPDDMAMEQVHAVISDLEARFRRDAPGVTRVLIHPEPLTDNRR